MATRSETQRQVLNLNETQAAVYFPMSDRVAFTVQGTLGSGSWGTAVVTLSRSNDGQNWYPLESATTLTAPSMTDQQDACFTTLRAQTTTVEGAAATANIIVHTMRDA